MKTLHKIIIFIIVIFIIIGLYFLLRNRQNFVPQTKFSKKLKDRLLKLKVIEKKKQIIKNDDLQKKIDKIQNKESYSGLFKLKNNINKSIEKYDNPDFDENYLRIKVSSSPLGYSYFLPSMNILKPSEFNQISGFNILKPYSVAENKETGELIKVDTISIDNPGISISGLVNKLDAKINHFESKESIEREIVKSVSGNVGGGFAGVSVQASFSYLTNNKTTSTFGYESNNLDFTKTTAFYGIKKDIFMDQVSYKTGFLIDLYNLGKLNVVKNQEDYNKAINFLKRYGSHVVKSVKLGKKCTLWDTIEKTSESQKNVLSIKACLSVSYGGWTTCVPSENNKEPCGPGRYCAQYEPTKYDKDGDIIAEEKKGTCQAVGGKEAGFSIGGEVCGSYTDTEKKEAQSLTSVSKIVLEGGSPESQGAILISRMNNTPVIDNSSVAEFLASSNNYDVPIELEFIGIWDLIRYAFPSDYKEDEDINSNFPYNLNEISPGCKIIISDIDVNKKFIETIKNDNKDFELKYDTTVIYTEKKYKKLLPTYIKTKTIDNYTDFDLINQGEKNYDNNYISFNASKLIPKIILRNPESSGNEDPVIESLLKEVTLILSISKDLKTAKLNYINPNNNKIFNIINISNKDSVKIINNVDYYSINLKLDIKIQTENFDDRFWYNSNDEITFYSNNNQYILEYKSSCNENIYISTTISAKKCEKIKTDINKITYYTFGYYDDELKINYLRLFVTENDFSLYFDKYVMNQICDNIEYAYSNDYNSIEPSKYNLIWAITDIMAIHSGSWNQNYADQGWLLCGGNVPTTGQPRPYGEGWGGEYPQDLNRDIGGPTIWLAVKYSKVDVRSDIPILVNIRTGNSGKWENWFCPGYGIKLVGSSEASVISQSGGTWDSCERYQAGCVYFKPAKEADEYITSIAVSVTDNRGPLTSLVVSIKNPNYNYSAEECREVGRCDGYSNFYRLTNVGSTEDMHESCGDDRDIRIVYAKDKINRNILSYDNSNKFNTFKQKTYWGREKIKNVNTDDINVCANECEKDPICTGATFIPSKSTCWLVKGLSPITNGTDTDYGLFKL